jgi:hypothetical protein
MFSWPEAERSEDVGMRALELSRSLVTTSSKANELVLQLRSSPS